MAEFFDMGGYAFFVWGSYGVVAAVLIQQYAAPLLRRRRLLRELAEASAESTVGDGCARARLTERGRDGGEERRRNHSRHPRSHPRHPRSVLSGGRGRDGLS